MSIQFKIYLLVCGLIALILASTANAARNQNHFRQNYEVEGYQIFLKRVSINPYPVQIEFFDKDGKVCETELKKSYSSAGLECIIGGEEPIFALKWRERRAGSWGSWKYKKASVNKNVCGNSISNSQGVMKSTGSFALSLKCVHFVVDDGPAESPTGRLPDDGIGAGQAQRPNRDGTRKKRGAWR